MADAYGVDPFEPFEVEGFLFTGPLYFIGPTPPPPDLAETCRGLTRLKAPVGGKDVEYLPAFTDLDAAERYLDTLPDRGAGLNAVKTRTREELLEVLITLALQRDYAIGVDHNGTAPARLLPLHRFLEVLRPEGG